MFHVPAHKATNHPAGQVVHRPQPAQPAAEWNPADAYQLSEDERARVAEHDEELAFFLGV